jgi:hypothetical protein
MSTNNVHTLIKNTLLLKNVNHHLSFQRVVIFLLMEGLASMVMATDWSARWLLKVGVAVAISWNKTAMKFVESIDSSFHLNI